LTALEARADTYAQRDHVTGTPAFDVAGRRFPGETSLATLAAAIDDAQSRRRRP
jgi:protein-disulfide isomerase